jgi:hypothetical protein
MSPQPSLPLIGAPHRRRLRAVWRSAGWPSHDLTDAELIAAGLLERCADALGRECLRVTDAGVQELVRASEQNRRVRGAHEGLVRRVAATLARDGRLAWCGLSLRSPVPDGSASDTGPRPAAAPGLDAPGLADAAAEPPDSRRWQVAMPDVYSIRVTSVPAYLQPWVHEIKVQRSDLLADLRLPHKRAAYLGVSSALYYVLAEGIGDADDVPPECGVLLARGAPAEHAERSDEPVALELLRHAPQRAVDAPGGLPFSVWMALARRTPQAAPEEGQLPL